MNLYLNADCMNPETGLPSYPDNYFDLAIVDPPYGIGRDGHNGVKSSGWNKYEWKEWDKNSPDQLYFDELFRVSKNQIIWGANYFTQFLPPSMGWIMWDKVNVFTSSDGELAFSSFHNALRIFRRARGSGQRFAPTLKDWEKAFIGIHPTQKPLALYRWLVKNYAKKGDLILDTHVGSAASLCIFEEMGFEYHAFELDVDYYEKSIKRLEYMRAQPKLFSGGEIFEASKQPIQGSLF